MPSDNIKILGELLVRNYSYTHCKVMQIILSLKVPKDMSKYVTLCIAQ